MVESEAPVDFALLQLVRDYRGGVSLSLLCSPHLNSNSFYWKSFLSSDRFSNCILSLGERECWPGRVKKLFERRKTKMREGEIDEMDAKEQQKPNWQAVLGRQPYPPQAGVTLASPTHPQFRVSNRSALPRFPAAAPESRACQRESGSSQRSAASALRWAPGSRRRGARVLTAKLLLRAVPKNDLLRGR